MMIVDTAQWGLGPAITYVIYHTNRSQRIGCVNNMCIFPEHRPGENICLMMIAHILASALMQSSTSPGLRPVLRLLSSTRIWLMLTGYACKISLRQIENKECIGLPQARVLQCIG
jgi:hypothetical protein